MDAPPVESGTRVGPDRPRASDIPYLALAPEEPAPPEDPEEPEAPEEPDAEAPEPEAPELLPGEPELLPEELEPDASEPLPEVPLSEPDVPLLPEQPFCFHWASVGESCWQSAAEDFLLFAVEEA